MRIVPGASPVCSATSLMLSPSAIGRAIVTGTDDATAQAHPPRPADRSQGVTNVLITGATGYIGGHLAPELLQRGLRVRCLARDPDRATLPEQAEVVQGDVLRERTLPPALEGIDVAYYLVHSMGGGHGAFAQRDRAGAEAFARAASAAGVRRVVYLGGLEGGDSEHLRSREEVAGILAAAVPDTVHARAAMVIGAGSASFLILRHLVERLPAMVCPRWIDTRTQPIAIRDVSTALADLATSQAPSEVQLGGADVLSYREMMQRYAAVAGRRAPLVVRVPVLTPRLSSYWLGLVTPVDTGVARPLVQGLSAEMLVRTRPPAGINDAPLGFDDAVREALAEVAG
jgi:uncharacterized protein YbjT (DUF2867 family)